MCKLIEKEMTDRSLSVMEAREKVSWMNRGKYRVRQRCLRLDGAVFLLLFYELASIAAGMIRRLKEGGPKADHSQNLLLISLVLLYLLVMETKQFRMVYLDMILYSGLVVMTLLMLGYLFDPHMGEIVSLWRDRAATASYLLMTGIVAVLQYCTSRDRVKEWFYGMCAAISFFLLACNNSVISFWIMAFSLLTIPVLIRPTALLCKKLAQMFFLFFLLVSNMGLAVHYTELLLVPVHCDLEQCVYLDLIAAVFGLLFFYCFERIPEGVAADKIVMRGFYRIDKLILKGMAVVFLLFAAGGTEWQIERSGQTGYRVVQGFARPLVEELEENRAALYQCMRSQGMVGFLLCMIILLLVMERMNRAWSWDKPVKGMLCVVAINVFPQLLIWEMAPNILPVAVILMTSVIACEEERDRSRVVARSIGGQGLERKEIHRKREKEERRDEKMLIETRQTKEEKMSDMKKEKKKVGREDTPKRKRKAGILSFTLGLCLLMLPVQAAEQETELEQDGTEQITEQTTEMRQTDEEWKISAGENISLIEVSRIMEATEDIEAKTSPEEGAETVIYYHSGDKIYVTGEMEDGWLRVRYQDLTGYIRPEQTEEIALDVEALDEEFATEESEGRLVVEEVERQRNETRRSRIWGAVIILLVAGVFATGIFSAIRGRKTGDMS